MDREQIYEEFDDGLISLDGVINISQRDGYNQALEDVYSIIISDIEDKRKVLNIQELVFKKKGINNCESERGGRYEI